MHSRHTVVNMLLVVGMLTIFPLLVFWKISYSFEIAIACITFAAGYMHGEKGSITIIKSSIGAVVAFFIVLVTPMIIQSNMLAMVLGMGLLALVILPLVIKEVQKKEVDMETGRPSGLLIFFFTVPVVAISYSFAHRFGYTYNPFTDIYIGYCTLFSFHVLMYRRAKKEELPH